MTAMMTMPTLSKAVKGDNLNNQMNDTHVHDKLLSATAANVCPPRMELRIQKPHIPMRLKIQGRITP